MKKNAILIAGIMFVAAGCATSDGQRASYYYDSPSQYDRADVSVSSTETVERDSYQRAMPTVDVDTSTAVSHDPASASYGSPGVSVSGSVSDDDDISADSSVRGGSLDARGYDQDANNDELEGEPDPINPGKEADSSIRGGSIYAREREWNHDSEPSSAFEREKRHMKADSSIRGGSIEARGGREARGDYESSSTRTDLSTDVDLSGEMDSRDDFGQGSSATWESDKAHGSVRGSANWNPSDDLLPDATSSESQSTTTYEFNNDASVGGAARSETGSGASSLDDEELDSESSASGSFGEPQSENESSVEIESDLNSSEQLESNISGEFDLDEQQQRIEQESDRSDFESSISVDSEDMNSRDSFSSSTSSERTSDIHHDEADLNAIESDLNDIEAAGAAATSESGTSSSSEVEEEIDNSDEFESNDPAMNRAGSPLGLTGGEPNFLYKDNRAQGVGSAASGDFATAPVNQGVELNMTDEQLSQKVKAALTRESTGTHGLMMNEVARNIQVSAENGEITLSGTVPSERHKDLVEIHAREIPGVKSVNNQLMVTPEADADLRDVTRGSDLEDVTSDLQN